jgi:hypothetical protein
MRIAAGIILIILGGFGLQGVIFLLSDLTIGLSSIPVSVVFIILWYIVLAAFYVTGGVLCLRKKYWRVCLASASFAVFMGIFEVVVPSVVLGHLVVMPWTTWIVNIGAVISTIFISLSKKEWQEISHRLDCKASYGG